MIEQVETTEVYTGDGETVVFAVRFPVAEAGHLLITERNTDGTENILSLGADYSVRITKNARGFPLSAEVTLTAPLPEGVSLSIMRLVPIQQKSNFADKGGYFPDEMERALDRLTMIGQQLHNRLARAVMAPEGYTAAQIANIIIESMQSLAALHSAVATINTSLDGKAPRVHGHGIAEIEGLVQSLAAKADAQAVATALARKSDTGHRHEIAHVDQLAAELEARAMETDVVNRLAGKVDKTDARLADARTPKAHAQSHHQDGADRITPEDIGALRPPPGDGKRYLVTANGYDEWDPVFTGTVTEHSHLKKCDAPDLHPQRSIQHLVPDLAAIRGDINGLDTAVQTVTTGLAGKAPATHQHEMAQIRGLLDRLTSLATSIDGKSANGHGHAVADITGLSGILNAKANIDDIPGVATAETAGLLTPAWLALILALKGMAYVEPPPQDGKAYAWKDGGWVVAGGAYLGEIRLLPFRTVELPAGWWYPSGQYYPLTSEVGKVLNSFSATFKSDWGIAVSGANISLLNNAKLFNGQYGRFMRAVNNSNWQPGAIWSDAIRNITGEWRHYYSTSHAPMYNNVPSSSFLGAFHMGPTNYAGAINGGGSGGRALCFNASRSVPTDVENRPYAVGMTPAVFLNVENIPANTVAGGNPSVAGGTQQAVL